MGSNITLDMQMKISVAMCTYNGERFLNEQLDSILAQTIPVDEIIICDDGSNDSTVKILTDYKNRHPKVIKIFNNPKTLKSVKNFEKAISLCTGDIIFLSDQDDIWHTEKVKITTDYFKQNSKISALCTNGYIINDDSLEIENHHVMWDVFAEFKKTSPYYSLFNFLIFKTNFATGATMAFKKSLLKLIAPIPEIQDFHHDEYIALIAASQDTFEFIAEKLIYYRIHDNQQVGGISFKKGTSKYNDTLVHYKWDSDYSNKDYQTLKTRIKNQVKWHNQYIPIYQEKIENQAVFDFIKKAFFKEFNSNLDMMKNLYPSKYRLLMITDKIFGKRQLKK